MAQVGYAGTTLQLVPYKGKLILLYWSPRPKTEELYNVRRQLDDFFESVEEEPVYIDKWDYKEDIHGGW